MPDGYLTMKHFGSIQHPGRYLLNQSWTTAVLGTRAVRFEEILRREWQRELARPDEPLDEYLRGELELDKFLYAIFLSQSPDDSSYNLDVRHLYFDLHEAYSRFLNKRLAVAISHVAGLGEHPQIWDPNGDDPGTFAMLVLFGMCFPGSEFGLASWYRAGAGHDAYAISDILKTGVDGAAVLRLLDADVDNTLVMSMLEGSM